MQLAHGILNHGGCASAIDICASRSYDVDCLLRRYGRSLGSPVSSCRNKRRPDHPCNSDRRSPASGAACSTAIEAARILCRCPGPAILVQEFLEGLHAEKCRCGLRQKRRAVRGPSRAFRCIQDRLPAQRAALKTDSKKTQRRSRTGHVSDPEGLCRSSDRCPMPYVACPQASFDTSDRRCARQSFCIRYAPPLPDSSPSDYAQPDRCTPVF